MRDQDKPFVLYRSGRGAFTIEPRGARGWRLMLAWIALSLPIMGGFALLSHMHPQGPAFLAALVIFMVTMAVWAIGGIMWMRARAEVVDTQALLKLKREQDRKTRRGR